MNSNNDLRRGKMGSLAFIFMGCVAFFAMGLYLWEKREGDAYDLVITELKLMKAQNKEFKGIADSSVAKVAEYEAKSVATEATIKTMRDELEVFRDQVADTREKQIKIREALASKRTSVVLPTGAIQVEIYSRPGPGTQKQALPSNGVGKLPTVVPQQKAAPVNQVVPKKTRGPYKKKPVGRGLEGLNGEKNKIAKMTVRGH